MDGLRPGTSEGIVQMRNGLRIKTNLQSLYGLKMYFFGVTNWELVAVIQAILRPGDVFIDGGANIGEITLHAAKRVGPQGRVVAVEASPEIAQRLRENIELNGLQNVEVVQVALGRYDEKRKFHLARGEYSGASSLTMPGNYSGQSVVVDGMKIDSLVDRERLERIDLIKLDLEGAEFEAMGGAARLLSHEGYRPIVLIEYHREISQRSGWDLQGLLRFFEEHEYALHYLTHSGYGEPIDPEAVLQATIHGTPALDLAAVPREKTGEKHLAA